MFLKIVMPNTNICIKNRYLYNILITLKYSVNYYTILIDE